MCHFTQARTLDIRYFVTPAQSGQFLGGSICRRIPVPSSERHIFPELKSIRPHLHGQSAMFQMSHKVDDTHVLELSHSWLEEYTRPDMLLALLERTFYWGRYMLGVLSCIELKEEYSLTRLLGAAWLIERRTVMGYMAAFIYISKTVYLWLKSMIQWLFCE
jgi:hypothetical protein